MRRNVLITALLAALCFVACKPDPIEVQRVRDIVYTVDNSTTTVHLTTEEEFDALLDRFCDYAEGGSSVTFHNTKASKSAKEATTFSTTNREEMKAWMRRMEDEGKTVTVTYDPATGTYNGMAYTNAPQPQPQPQLEPTHVPVPHPNGGVLTYVCDAPPMWRVILSIDTVNNLMYATMFDSIYIYVGRHILAPEGICRYHWFNSVDSNYGSYSDRGWLFIQSINEPERLGNHFYITGNLDFGDGFTLHFADFHNMDLLTVDEFEFVRVDNFPLSVHRSNECDIIVHTHDNTFEGQSYVFSNVDCPLPFEKGKFTWEHFEWNQNAPYFQETISLRYNTSSRACHFGLVFPDSSCAYWYHLDSNRSFDRYYFNLL